MDTLHQVTPFTHTTKKYATALALSNKPTRLIRLREVMARVGLPRSSIYARIKEGTFPASVRLGDGEKSRSVAWSEATIDAWIAERLTGAAEVAREGA